MSTSDWPSQTLCKIIDLWKCGFSISGGNPYKALMSIQQIIIINKLFAYQTFVVGM